MNINPLSFKDFITIRQNTPETKVTVNAVQTTTTPVISSNQFITNYAQMLIKRNNINKNEKVFLFVGRINALKNCPDLQHYWKMSKNDLPKFIKFLFDSGIQRDKSMHIVADESTAYKYYKLDGSEVVKNETYTIISPCWSWENKILGKGIIE